MIHELTNFSCQQWETVNKYHSENFRNLEHTCWNVVDTSNEFTNECKLSFIYFGDPKGESRKIEFADESLNARSQSSIKLNFYENFSSPEIRFNKTTSKQQYPAFMNWKAQFS